jgi:hypothetical protein
VNLGRLRRVTLAAHPLTLLASVLVAPGLGRQARRAGGAPLMIVKKILTAQTCRHRRDGCRIDGKRSGHSYSGQSNRAQMVRVV